MADTQLKQKATAGMIWTSIQKYTSIIVQFICGIVLARLLTPEDYGCIGMLAVFTNIAASIVSMGFASALIQKKRPTDEDYSTVFFWNEAISILMYMVLFVAAPFIARFYRIPLLSDVLRVQGLILILNATLTIQDNRLRKQFKFKRLAIVYVIAGLVSTVVAISMAYNGFGVWSLVGQSLSASVTINIIFWTTNKWRPMFVFSMQSFRELFGFGFYIFLSNIVNQIGNSLQTLLMGRIYNASILGYYSKASSTEMLASQSISDVLLQVTYPLYSELQNQKEQMISAIKRITVTVAYVTFPILSLLILLAKPIFVMLYSERWLPSVPYFQVLCVGGFVIGLQAVNYQPVLALGKSKLLFKWTIIKRVVGTTIMIGGLILWGVKGLLAGVVAYNYFIYVVNAVLVSKHIGYNLRAQLKDLMPVVLLIVTSFITTLGLSWVLNFDMYINAVAELIFFCTIYLGGSIFFKMDSYSYFKSILPLLTSKFKLKKNNNL